jgi:hypothetical protein
MFIILQTSKNDIQIQNSNEFYCLPIDNNEQWQWINNNEQSKNMYNKW